MAGDAEGARPRPDRDVAVTGLGAVTPYGVGVDALWDGWCAGRQTADRVRSFDVTGYPCQIACELDGFDPQEHLPRKLVRQLDPFAQFGLIAAHEALAQAGLVVEGDGVRVPLIDDVDPTRVGVLCASGIGGINEMTDQYARQLAEGPGKVRPFMAIALPLNMAGGQIAIRHGLQAQSWSVVSACASGTDGIGAALDLLRAGRADVVVAGGAEAAVNPLSLAGFGAAGAMSRRNDDPASASRPFDVGRDGFVAGEGAGMLVLETLDHARARGAEPLALLSGYGASNDAHHPTAPHPEGSGASRALELCLADAELPREQVGHVNAHGTSTPTNDPSEAAALRRVFGDQADHLALSSTKSAIGHLLGAAGGVEAVATVRALTDGLVPPTLNLDEQDPDCPVDVVTGAPRRVAASAALSESFGFGGHNGVLAFRAWSSQP